VGLFINLLFAFLVQVAAKGTFLMRVAIIPLGTRHLADFYSLLACCSVGWHGVLNKSPTQNTKDDLGLSACQPLRLLLLVSAAFLREFSMAFTSDIEQPPVVIDYYSDLLCIWAWIAQRRVEELNRQMGARVSLNYHFMDVFGDVPGKIARQWAERGGYDAFADHVTHSAADFAHISVHPQLWRSVKPTSSVPSHLAIKACQLAHGEESAVALCLQLRRAFFEQARDISQWSVILEVLAELSLSALALQSQVDNGMAQARLMADYQKAKAEGLRGSPSYVLDGGRQILFGNVGYRILSANVEELLRHPSDEASWC